MRAKPTILLLLFLLWGPTASVLWGPTASAESDPFPLPTELEPQVEFWKRIYGDVDTQGGLLHDSRMMGVVYEKIRFRAGTSRRSRERQIEQTKKTYNEMLRTLASGKRTGLSADEQRVLALFPDGVSNATLDDARGRIRFQLGQADKFRTGVIRSGRWEPHIARVLAEQAVPYELAALPHVESSYNPDAHSHAGAAGLWQFTRSTGRLFMRVDHVVDERLDPYASSVAAARLLLANYRRTGTWPTAITAYNHGTAGMERAIRKLGTRDIATIVRDYRSRSFGFASRNFYAEFLAAVEVSRNAEQHFGELQRDPPEDLEAVLLDHYYAPATLARIFVVSERTLREHNRSLLAPVWSGQKYVPKGHLLRFPRPAGVSDPGLLLAQVPASERILRQRPDLGYRVRRGDTLSGIARRYGVSVNDLVAMNGLRSRHRIRIGQQLKLPTKDRPTTVAMVRDHDRNARPKLARPEDGRYRVHRGDTLTGIAQTFDVSVEELMAANDLRSRNRIYVGQPLFIPGAVGPAGGTYVVQRGDSLEEIARQHGVSLHALQEHNHIVNRNRIQVGQVLSIPGTGRTAPVARDIRYVVHRGDTLARIAARHGSTPEAIEAASGLRNRNRIYVGQELIIPAPGAPTPVAVARAETPAPERAVAPEPPTPAAAVAPVEPTRVEPVPSEPGEAEVAHIDPSAPAAPAPEAPTPEPEDALLATTTREGLTLRLPWAPRRYAVAPDGSIVVHPEETLGHFADWLEVPTQRLRNLNRMPYQSSLEIGRRVRLDFNKVERSVFEERRLAHHRSLQTAFFDAYSVSGTEAHVLRRGETLWKLARGKYDVPVWLIQQYNPGLDLNALRPGMRIEIPVVAPRAESEA